MRDGRGGDRRRGRPRYSYNAGRAGVVGGTGYPTRRAGVILFLLVTGHRTILVRRSSIQGDVVACIRDHLSNYYYNYKVKHLYGEDFLRRIAP